MELGAEVRVEVPAERRRDRDRALGRLDHIARRALTAHDPNRPLPVGEAECRRHLRRRYLQKPRTIRRGGVRDRPGVATPRSPRRVPTCAENSRWETGARDAPC
eukprot:870290-Prymnesium_polylepis.1